MATTSTRLHGIDLARAVAIMGMMLIHFNEIAGTIPYTGPDWLVWLDGQLEGRAAVAFVILAGIGMSLMSRRARISGTDEARRTVCKALFRRAIVLFGAGLLFHQAWDGDILHCYGIFISIGTLLLFAPSRWLWMLTLLLNAGFLAMFLLFNNHPGWAYDAGWDWDALVYADFWTAKGFLRSIVFNGWFPLFPWLGFMLLGIWLGRLDLGSRSVRRNGMLWGGGIAVAATGASWLLTNRIGPGMLGMPYEFSYALFGRECLPPTPFFVIQSGGAAVFMIALCLGVADRLGDSRGLKPWLVFGQCALSIYIGHVFLFLVPLIYLDCTGYSLWITLPMGAGAILATLLLIVAWHRFFDRGPLEIVIRRLAEPTRS
ncbi:DUF418 domain-containing protein [Pontiella sp.]|uniref:DUF418 domain-containing protein n=1 Tax=Pontiella sp. TaxID=2837462 RepID=UPI003563FFA1